MLSKIKTKIHMGFFTFFDRQRLVLSALVFLSSMTSVWAQCPVLPAPTTNNPTWGLCRTSPSVVVTLQDGIDRDIFDGDDAALVYYNKKTGGVKLAVTDPLVDATDVYAATVDINGCESAVRTGVRVVFLNGFKPVGDAEQSFCTDIAGGVIPTVSSIVTDTGNTYYSTNISVQALPDDTPLVSGFTYFVSNESGICISERLPVKVIVDPLTPPVTSNPLDFCINKMPTDPIVLFDQFIVKPNNTGVWTTTAPVAAPATFDGAVNLSTLPVGAHTYSYTVKSTNKCPDQVNTVTVTVLKLPEVGSPGKVTFCSAGTGGDLFDSIGKDKPTDVGGIWSPALNSGTGVYTPGVDKPGVYTYTVNSLPCDPVSTTVEVTEEIKLFAGADKTITICEDDIANQNIITLFNELGPTANLGGVWTTTTGVAIGDGNQGTIDPRTFSVANSPYVFTYTVPAGVLCVPGESKEITIVVEPFQKAGVGGNLPVCSNEPPVDLLTKLTGSTTGGVWKFNNVEVSNMFDPATDPEGVYTYEVDNDGCVDSSSSLNVTIVPFIDPGVGKTINYCEATVATEVDINLFDELTGTPDPSGTWSGPQGPIAGGNNPTLKVSDLTTVGVYDYVYTVPSGVGCPNTATISISVDTDNPNAGTSVVNPIAVCSADGTFDLMAQIGVADQNGQWTDKDNKAVSANLDLATAVSGVYTYTVRSIGCNKTATSTLTLDITPAKKTGTSPADTEYCDASIAVGDKLSLFSKLLDNPDVGGTWAIPQGANVTITDGHVGTINLKSLAVGSYDFFYSIAGNCSTPPTKVTVIIKKQLSAGDASVSITLCTGDAPISLLQQLKNADAGGVWKFNGNPVSETFNPAVQSEGAYVYEISSSVCTFQTKTVTIKLNQSPKPGISGSRNFCVTDLGTIPSFDLFNELTGTKENNGTWQGPVLTSNGNLGTVDVNSLSQGSHVFTYTVPANANCSAQSATVTVTIDPEPEAGSPVIAPKTVCRSELTLDLNSLLDATAQSGGQWSLNGGGNVPSILNLANAVSGTYTYTVTSKGCAGRTDTATVDITIDTPPNAGEKSITNICIDNVNTTPDLNLFSLLKGSPEIGGTWRDPQGQVIAGGHLATLSVAGFTVGQYDYSYTINSSNTTCVDDVEILTVSIDAQPNSGTVTLAQNSYCTSDGQVDLNKLLSGQQSGGVWTQDSTGLVVTGGLINTNIGAGKHGYTYTVTSIGCGTYDETKLSIDIKQGPKAGQDATATFCIANITSGTTTTVNLFDRLGATADAGGTWNVTTLTGGDKGTLDLRTLAVGTTTYTYTVTSSNGCQPDSKTVTVIVQGVPEAGLAVLPNVSVCNTEASFNLFDLLVADNGKAPLAGGVWTNKATGAVIANGIFNPSSNVSGTYTYTVTSTSCSVTQEATDVTITVKSPAVLTSFTSAGEICSGAKGVVNFTGTPGAVVTFDYTGNTSGAQTVTLNATGTATYTTANNLVANTEFTLSSIGYAGPKGCSQAIANKATVLVEQIKATTVTGTATICVGTTTDLSITGPSNGILRYNINGGATQQIQLNADETIPTLLPTGTGLAKGKTTYNFVSMTAATAKACVQSLTLSPIEITVIDKPTASITTVPSVCNGQTAKVRITGTAGATVTYEFGTLGNQTFVMPAAGSIDIDTPTLVNAQSGIAISLKSAATTSCSTVLTDSKTITVTDLPIVNNFNVSTTQVCSGSSVNLLITGGPSNALLNYEVVTNGNTTTGTITLDSTGNGTKGVVINAASTIRLTSIVAGCTNSNPTNAVLNIGITTAPNVAGAVVSVQNRTSVCYESNATVTITGANSLADGSYDIIYNLTGSNVASKVAATITIDKGAASFDIPASLLTNSGSTTVSVEDIKIPNINCTVSGASFTNSDSFTINPKINNVTYSDASNKYYLCQEESPVKATFSDLTNKFNLNSGFDIKWINTATGLESKGILTSGSYQAEVYNTVTSCTSSTVNRLVIDVIADECYIVTEVVTPNVPGNPGTPGGTTSEVFTISNIDKLYPAYTFEIFNRYGVKLFDGNKQNPSWDGRSSHGRLGSDEVAPTGVYFYILNFNKGDKAPVQKYFYLRR